MPLSREQQQTLLDQMAAKIGCPVTTKDRLDAFSKGLAQAVTYFAPMVSLDIAEPAQTPNGPAGVIADAIIEKANQE